MGSHLVPIDTPFRAVIPERTPELPPSAHDDALSSAFPSGACHELYAARDADAAAMTGLALGLALGLAHGPVERSSSNPLVWVRQAMVSREGGAPYSPGIAELGLPPARLILVEVRDAISALQAGLESARSPALGAVLIELWGETKALDLTASRRLALAVRSSGLRLLLLRIAARPRPSAAASRWEVRAAPSRPRAANAPGNPGVILTLLHGRVGQEGLRYQLEWDRDARHFTPLGVPLGARASPPRNGAALSLPLVSPSLNRPGSTDDGDAPHRRTG